MIKGFVIKLAGSELSEKLAEECVKAAIAHGVDAKLFGGINGHVADPILENAGLFPFKPKSKASKPGVKGCFLSHYFLWEKCMNLKEPLVIMEHDGLFIRDLPADICDKFDDVLNLDSFDQFSKDYEAMLEQEGPLLIQEYYNEKSKKGTLNGEYLRGAYAYIIKPHAAKKLVDSAHKHGYLPADHQIGKRVVRLQTTLPSLARLHPHYSSDGRIKSDSLTRNGPPV